MPRKLAEAVFSFMFSASCGGGAGGSRPEVLGSLPRGGFCKVDDLANGLLGDNARKPQGGIGILVCLSSAGGRRANRNILRVNIYSF